MPAPPFSLALFGPFEACYHNQPIANFATDKIRSLLAYLAIESGKPIRRETLATLLWPNYPDDVALRNLRQSLYRLRRTLEQVDPDLPGRLITQTRLTVTLHAEYVSLDVSRFLEVIRSARQADDPIPYLDQVHLLYRGDLLQGLTIADAYAFNEWLNIQREILHQQAVESLARLLALYEDGRDFESVLVIAPKLLVLEPWHEETHRRLMRTYVQMGNRSRAMAQYRELEALLMDELGADPSPASTTLFTQINSNTFTAAPPPLGSGPGRKPAAARTVEKSHIPVPITPLIGRQVELAYVTETLQDPACRLLTVTGPGGIGKTRLSIEAAHRLAAASTAFEQGTLFVSLAQDEQGDQLTSAVSQALGISLQARSDPRRELIQHLQNQDLLIILDNFEHLLEKTEGEILPAALSFIVDILTAVPGVSILATSREPLGIQPEWVYPLDGLPYARSANTENADLLADPAPQLFIQNARRYNAAFEPDSNKNAILEICRLTDGLPLAIEMAATWLRIYSCEDIAKSISNSLDFLTSSFRDAPARQRSMRVIFNSTWDQLSPVQQATLAALAVFRGGFSIQAALVVTEADILDLSILIEKSLLRRTNDNRYFLHELIGQFAKQKLAHSGKDDLVRERHARYYFADLAEQMIAFSGSNPGDAVTHIRQDMDNLRAAWNWSVEHANLELLEMGMKELTQFWVFTGANLEGEPSIRKAIAAIRDMPSEPYVASVHSFLAGALAWLQMGIGKNDESERNIEIALALADEGGNADRRATALSLQGWLLQNKGRVDEAETVLNEACTIFEENGNQLQLSLALIRIGSVYWWRNRLDKSLEFYERSLAIEQRMGNKRGINRAYGGLGMAYMHLERFEQALIYLEKAMQLDRELGNQPGIVRNAGHLGNIYLVKGDFERAAASYQEALQIEQKTGSKNTSSIWLSNLGLAHTRLKDYGRALAFYDQAISIAIEMGSKPQLCEAQLGKANIFIRQGKLAEAQALVEEGLATSFEIDRNVTKLRGIILKARLLALSGEPQNARRLLESSRETLKSEYKESKTNARLFYELWKIDNRTSDAEAALTLYKECLSRSEHAEYTERIQELSAFLKPGP